MQKTPYSTTAIKQFLISRMPYATYSNPKRSPRPNTASSNHILLPITKIKMKMHKRPPIRDHE